MISKKVFNPKSKTHWVNGIAMGASAGLLVLPGLNGSIHPEAYPWVLAGFAGVNHVLRNMTTKSIDDK